ncbi:ABC transporter permease [Bacteroidota bacterium]
MSDNKRHINKPPGTAVILLKIFLRTGLKDQCLDDFEEMFQYIAEDAGIKHAKRWYWTHMLKSIPKLVSNSFQWGVSMFINYFKITFRNLLKNKGYAAINIFGLAVGIACCMIILFWVQDEFSYDNFHLNKSDIFRVIQQWNNKPDLPGQDWIPGPVAPLLKSEYPEILDATRLVIRNREQISAGEKSFINTCAAVDPSFFSIFSFPFLNGNKETALNNPNSIVISASMAEKIFGTANSVGKILKYDNGIDLTITGVFTDVPVNSHLQFDFCVPYSLFHESFAHWDNNDHKVYVQLTSADKSDDVNSKISDILKNHQTRAESILILQPLKDIHLYALTGVDRITYIYIFAAMAAIVLLIACINFMNLSTAKVARRAKEVGLRKVIGSSKRQLITQFLSESMILAFIAMTIGLLLAVFLLHFVTDIVGHEIKMQFSSIIVISILSITLLTGIIAGSYPAFFLSSFNPVCVMKGLHGSDSRTRIALFRKTLTVVQFSISIFFIISAISIYRQMTYTNSRDMGIDKDNLILLDMRDALKEKYETIKEVLLQQPSINSITSIDIPPLIYWNNTTDAVEWEGMNQNNRLSFSVKTVDYDFLKTFDAEMAAGRFFSKTYITDASDGYIINEAAARAMGLDSPLGTGVSLYGVQGKIIGIVKDFHLESLRENISPVILRIRRNKANYVCIRIMPGVGNKIEVIDSIRKTFAKIIPSYPFYYSFLANEYSGLYEDETLTSKITLYITLLMIVISCLGLLGLASFMTEQRKKEIGMRKVLGASVKQIVVMLSNDFVKRILISNIIAWPIAYYFVNNWLDNFAYHTELKLDVFIYAGLLSIFLSIATVSYQSIKASLANPIESIKYE